VPTYYETLGVLPTASMEEIRRAYRQQARQFHPDRHLQSTPADAARAAIRMADVNHAWEVLSDTASRETYDLELALARIKAGRSSGGSRRASAGPARPPVAPAPAAGFHDEDFVDVAPNAGVWTMIFRAVPWLLVIVVLGGIFVFTAFAASRSDGSPSPSEPVVRPAAAVGDCIRWLSSTELGLVGCDGPNNGRIVEKVKVDKSCPDDADQTYLPEENVYACVRPD
jgi:hypothetical protein